MLAWVDCQDTQLIATPKLVPQTAEVSGKLDAALKMKTFCGSIWMSFWTFKGLFFKRGNLLSESLDLFFGVRGAQGDAEACGVSGYGGEANGGD